MSQKTARDQRNNQVAQQRTALHQALAAQQNSIEYLVAKVALQDVIIDDIAALAGVKGRVAAIRRQADADNPAQPVPNPPSEQPYETTEQAITPEARDDVRNPGMTPGSTQHVPAEQVTTALTPGEDLPTQPTNYLDNIQAPIAGTETHVPDEMTRIEEDVRVSPMVSPAANPEVAFPWVTGPNNSNVGDSAPDAKTASAHSEERTFAAIHLARLQIQAGIGEGDDELVLGQKIASSDVTNDEIASNIKTLSAVVKSASVQSQAPARVTRQAARSVPSLASSPSHLGGHGSLAAESADSDLFD